MATTRHPQFTFACHKNAELCTSRMAKGVENFLHLVCLQHETVGFYGASVVWQTLTHAVGIPSLLPISENDTKHWFNNTWTFIDHYHPRLDPKRPQAYASTAFNQRQSAAHVTSWSPSRWEGHFGMQATWSNALDPQVAHNAYGKHIIKTAGLCWGLLKCNR